MNRPAAYALWLSLLALPPGPPLRAQAPGPWGIGLGYCRGTGSAFDLYGPGVNLEGTRQVFQVGALRGRARVSAFAFQRGRSEFSPFGKLNARADGFIGSHDWIWDFDTDHGPSLYLLLGLGVASYSYRTDAFATAETGRLDGISSRRTGLAWAPGLGGRTPGGWELELRFDGIAARSREDFPPSFGAGWADFAPSHLVLAARIRF